jgi:CHASE3 domain sensor protein
MESTVKIATLEEQMKEVNKKLDKADRKIDELCEKVDLGFANIQVEMGRTYVRKSEYELDKQNTREEVKKMQDIWNWAVRLILGAIILALLGTILI